VCVFQLTALCHRLPGARPDLDVAQVAEEQAEKVHRYERTFGAFERTFTLPATVAPEKIKATYENGLLTITLPKVEAAKPHLIEVEATHSEGFLMASSHRRCHATRKLLQPSHREHSCRVELRSWSSFAP